MSEGEQPGLMARLTRRELVKAAGITGTMLLGGILAACGGPAPSGAPASSSAAAPASGSTAGSPAAGGATSSSAPGGATTSSAAGAAAAAKPAAAGGSAPAAPASWDALLAAAKSEGNVVVTGAPDPATRQALPAAFKTAFGIDMNYLPGATEVTARLQGERAAGQYTLDAEINGSDSVMVTLYGNKWLDPIKPALLLPDAIDNSKWKAGAPWFRDPGGDTIMQILNTASSNFTVNTAMVSPADLPNADAALDPKWKGKICAFDPSVNGVGLAIGCALYLAKGPDYCAKLYKGQNVVLSRDYKQVADWVAHGNYPIGLAVASTYLADYVKAGIKFANVSMPDVLWGINGGFGLVALLNHAPHPNAARVFANWMASKEGMALYAKLQSSAPARNDIDPSSWVPPDLIPKPGVKYLDTYDYDFEINQRSKIRDIFAQMLK